MELKGKTALVTGSNRGIGFAIALSLANEGCNIVIAARSIVELNKAAEAIKNTGASVLAVDIDLSNMNGLKKLIDKTVETFGNLHILINNAGLCVPMEFLDVSEEMYDKHFMINMKSPFFLTQYALEVMKNNNEGHIINVSSTAALDIPAFHSVYGAAKLAMSGFSKALYNTCKPFNIKVSTLYPHYTDTQMLREINPPVSSEKWMTANDMAETVLFLLKSSDKMIIKDIVPIAFQTER